MIPLIGTNSIRLFQWLNARLLPLVEAWERAAEARRQRRALMALDDRMLRDIGISRADVERSAHQEPLQSSDIPRYAPARLPATLRKTARSL